MVQTTTAAHKAVVPMVVSSMWELIASLRLLSPDAQPSKHSAATQLLPDQRERTRSLRLRMLPALMTAAVPPHFLTPPTSCGVGAFDSELAAIAALSPDVIAVELGWSFGDCRRWQDPLLHAPPVLHKLLNENSALEQLAAEIARYWRKIVAPVWNRVEDRLLAECARLGGALPVGALQKMNPAYRWKDERLSVTNTHLGEVEVDPRAGITLVVSAFSTSHTRSLVCPRPDIAWGERAAMLPYPARFTKGIGADTAHDGRQALASVVGHGRAAVLVALDEPRSTTELAAMLQMSPAGISRHLALLFRTGLAKRQRSSYSVRYGLTASGRTLLGVFGLQNGDASPGE